MNRSSLFQGSHEGHGLKIGVVCARFNREISERLLKGALETLAGCGVQEEDIICLKVPGAVEIPLAVQCLARLAGVDAIVALGAVIRGETTHHEHVARLAAEGCLRVSLEHHVPVGFGLLTCENSEQALARSSDVRNKGSEAALAAMEMADLLRLAGHA